MTPTEKTIRIAVVQAESSPADPQENVRILRTFAQQAAHAGCSAMSGVTVFEVDPALLARFRSGDDSMRCRYYPDKRRPELYTAEPSLQNVTLSSI